MTLRIRYRISAPYPATHYVHIQMNVDGWNQDTLDLRLPVWTPGSYLVREYAKHLENFRVNHGLPWRKVSKNHWRIQTAGVSDIEVHYDLYANDLSVRTNHVDDTHLYLNGAATFLFIPDARHLPCEITIEPPYPDWRVSTALEPLGDYCFRALDYDMLVDSPIEVGQQAIYPFTVRGIAHELAVWGTLPVDAQPLLQDISKIVETAANIFGGLPYQQYLFLLHLPMQGYGGLEHANCCSLLYSRRQLTRPEGYQRFLNLVAHEFFHLWNVKRIKPAELVPFDYDQENYTTSLWFCEGVTSYYDLVIPWRAGLYDAKRFLELLSEEITRYYQTPGRDVQSLTEASFDAWIKYYRRDANSVNSQVSYYLKGALVTLLLDLRIRQHHQNQRSFDDVLQKMWREFGAGQMGFTPAQLYQVIQAVAGQDLRDFWRDYIEGVAPLPLAEALADFGLALQAVPGKAPFTGIALEAGRTTVKQVLRHSPAWWAGIDAGDELVAVNGQQVRPETWPELLNQWRPGETVTVTLVRREELRQYPVTLQAPAPERYQIRPLDNATDGQRSLGLGWLGAAGFDSVQ
ncbi:MAG: M61 family metallopeptidase [Gloeomargarita sp. SKYBB_i_bin120]|nr:M61 family metallopeptidase [Gloeomargarita sp. SKYB120]MDW8178806.1 M61 family metallopeptidase [Gloeomargarita sp. SKYBB_i_bin120]